MSKARTTIIDLSRLSLAHGEGKRIEVPVELDPFELAGQTYLAEPGIPHRPARDLPAQRRLRLPAQLPGPRRRAVHALPGAGRPRPRGRVPRGPPAARRRPRAASPYVEDDELDIGRWAHDATLLALPTRILCRPDCAGLCPTCGVSLNDADPADHVHDSGKDPRWAALDNLKLE